MEVVGIVMVVEVRSTRRWRRIVTVVLASTFVSLVGIEAFLRLVYPVSEQAVEEDPRCLVRLIPGSRKLFVHHELNGGEKIEVEINEHGFRGDDFDLVATSPRVVVYGDSFIQGNFSALRDTFAEQLRRRLGESLGQPIEVVNAGVVSFGPDQVCYRLESELDELRPNLVVVSVYSGNDYGDLLRNKMFRVDEAGGLVENPYVIGDDVRRNLDPTSWRNRLLIFRHLSRALRLSSRQAGVDQEPIDRWLALCVEEYQEYVVEGDNRVTNLRADHYDADVSLRPSSTSARYKRRLMKAVLARIQGVMAEREVPWVLMIVPAAIDVCEGYDHQVDTSRYPEYRRETLSVEIAAAARELGIPYVDLFGAFRAVDGDLYFRHGDDHWNRTGQALASELMAEKILDMQALSGE